MPEPPPFDPRDLDLARRLDAGEAADGSDALHEALGASTPLATPVAPEASARLWEAVAAQTGLAPEASALPEDAAPTGTPEARPARRGAKDRAPARGARTRVVRWAAVASVVLVASIATWLVLDVQTTSTPMLVASASGEIETWTGPDGSTVTLRPHSRLVRLDERSYRLEGEAFFAVARDPSRPFTVEAGQGTVRVLGTRFDVSTWGGETAVFVEEGRVEVAGAGDAVILSAGDAATASASGVAAVAAPEAEAFLDWQRGEAAFSGETVRRVVQEIGHHFSVGVTVPDDVARETISGVVALDSAPEALGELGRILGGTFQREGAGYRFARP